MFDSVHTITIAVFVKDTHVLLLQRNPDEYPGHGDKWELIGGHIHLTEYPEKAAGREVAEETGIVGFSLDFFRVDRFKRDANNWIYTATIRHELPVTISHEHQTYRWMPVSEALQMQLACKHSDILRDIVQSKGSQS